MNVFVCAWLDKIKLPQIMVHLIKCDDELSEKIGMATKVCVCDTHAHIHRCAHTRITHIISRLFGYWPIY